MKELALYLLRFLLFFVIFFLLINAFYLLIITKTDWDFRRRIESLSFDNPDFDVLIFGSSLAQYGVDSELMTKQGLKSYNMAMVGNTIKTCYIQLQEYINKYPEKPKYVLLVVNTFLEGFDQDRIHPVIEFTMKNQNIDLTDIPVSKFRWQGTELFKKALSKEYRSGYISYGQLRRKKILPDDSQFNYLFFDKSNYEKAKWIEKISLLCTKENIKLLLIDIPGVNEAQNTDSIGPYHISINNNCTATLYNLSSIEFCEFIDPDSDWVGLSHFNEMGAAKFTEEMIKLIPFSVNR